MAAEVPESEVRTFANRNNMNLFRTSNINENVRSNNTIDGASSIKEFVPDHFSYCIIQFHQPCLFIIMKLHVLIVFCRS